MLNAGFHPLRVGVTRRLSSPGRGTNSEQNQHKNSPAQMHQTKAWKFSSIHTPCTKAPVLPGSGRGSPVTWAALLGQQSTELMARGNAALWSPSALKPLAWPVLRMLLLLPEERNMTTSLKGLIVAPYDWSTFHKRCKMFIRNFPEHGNSPNRKSEHQTSRTMRLRAKTLRRETYFRHTHTPLFGAQTLNSQVLHCPIVQWTLNKWRYFTTPCLFSALKNHILL